MNFRKTWCALHFRNPKLTCLYAIHRWEKRDGATVFGLNKNKSKFPKSERLSEPSFCEYCLIAPLLYPATSFLPDWDHTDYHLMKCDGMILIAY